VLSGKLFRNGIILLDKLNLRTVYRNVTAAMQIYDFLCHTVVMRVCAGPSTRTNYDIKMFY